MKLKTILAPILCITIGQCLPLLAQAQFAQPRTGHQTALGFGRPYAKPKTNPRKFGQKTLGGGDTGGGDAYTEDFLKSSLNQVLPLVQKYGSLLGPQVDAKKFERHINPTRLVSVDHVFETCDPKDMLGARSTTPDPELGREVMGCYNSTTGFIYISRSIYPLDLEDSLSKQLFIAHEIFRSMGIEGDQYELTRKMPNFFFLNYSLTRPETTDTGPVFQPDFFRDQKFLMVTTGQDRICDYTVQYEPEQHTLWLNTGNTINGVFNQACADIEEKQTAFICLNGLEHCTHSHLITRDTELYSIKQRLSVSPFGVLRLDTQLNLQSSLVPSGNKSSLNKTEYFHSRALP